MKVKFKINLSKGTDPEKTIFEVHKVRWDKNNKWVKMKGVIYCCGNHWEHEQIFYIPSLMQFQTREEILKNLPLRID